MAYTKFHCFVEDLAHKVHNLFSDQLIVALTDTAPTAATDDELADISEATYTNCSSRNITTSASAQTSGTYKLTLTDLVLTASGGTVGPFRYVVVYNGTAANDELICYDDKGSSITLQDGETLTIDFSDANGLLQIV